MITCSWKLSVQHSTYTTTCQLNNQHSTWETKTNFICLIISFYSPMLKRYWTGIRSDGSWIIAVRLKFIVANSWPHCEDSVKCPPKCIICHRCEFFTSLWGQRKSPPKCIIHLLTQGLFPVSGPIVLTQNGGPSERCGSYNWPHNSHQAVREFREWLWNRLNRLNTRLYN